jgi:hypothetical protein
MKFSEVKIGDLLLDSDGDIYRVDAYKVVGSFKDKPSIMVHSLRSHRDCAIYYRSSLREMNPLVPHRDMK